MYGLYADLNMVRAGVVTHPSEWPFCGYNEIQNPRQRYSLIDFKSLMEVLGIRNTEDLKEVYGNWVMEALEKHRYVRQSKWTEAIAVGSEDFVRETKERLGIRAIGREVVGDDGTFELRESTVAYDSGFAMENGDLRGENAYFWDVSL
jgi:putative transposase